MSYFTLKNRPHGAKEWLVERGALALLIPLGLWLVISGLPLVGAGHETVLAWAGNGLNAVLLGLTAVLFCLFGALAWKVIIEDYVHGGAKGLAMIANSIFFAALAAAALFFIVSIALGSAPAGA